MSNPRRRTPPRAPPPSSRLTVPSSAVFLRQQGDGEEGGRGLAGSRGAPVPRDAVLLHKGAALGRGRAALQVGTVYGGSISFP